MGTVILGAGGHAQEIFGIIQSNKIDFVGFVDETLTESRLLYGFPVFTAIPYNIDVHFVCGVGNPVIKEKFEERVLDRLSDPIVDFSTRMFVDCRIEKGVVIGANCSLTIDIVVGRSTSINSNCVISHNCRIGKRCHISGGSILSGNVTLEDDVYLGAGVKIIPKVYIGAGAIVGAGAVVVQGVDPYTIVAGCPAKVLRTYQKGERINL